MNSEDFIKQLEAESTAHFGPPELRAKKKRRYLHRLQKNHGESLIRQLLAAIRQADGFSLNIEAPDPLTAPLEELLSPFEYPFYEIRIVRAEAEVVIVDRGEGVPLAGSGARYTFRRQDGALVLQSREDTWIS